MNLPDSSNTPGSSNTRNVPRDRKRMLLRLLFAGFCGLLAALLIAALAPAGTATGLIVTHVTFLTIGLVLGAAYICLNFRQQEFVKTWISQAGRDLTKQQKRYVAVFGLILFMIIASLTASGTMMRDLLICVFVFVCCVAVWDLIAWYGTMSEKLLGKAAIAIGFAIASTYAYGLAGQKIAVIIQATPTNFTRALVLTAIMQIPVLIAIAGAFISAFCIIASSLLMIPWMIPGFDRIAELFVDRTPGPGHRFAFATRLFQVVFFASFGMTLFTLSQKNAGWYDAAISGQVRSFIYDLDMYPGLECAIEKGSKLAPLGDARFLVASRTQAGDIMFQPPRKCD